MLFPTLKFFWCKQKIPGGGGCVPLHLLVKWGRWFLQIVDIHVGNFNMKLTGRWFPQIVDRDSGNLYPIYI